MPPSSEAQFPSSYPHVLKTGLPPLQTPKTTRCSRYGASHSPACSIDYSGNVRAYRRPAKQANEGQSPCGHHAWIGSKGGKVAARLPAEAKIRAL